MAKIEAIVESMRACPANVSFGDVMRVCRDRFGPPRRRNGSHVLFATPWPGDPRINIQDRNGKAKPYQVRQVLAAIDKLDQMTREDDR